LCAGHIRRVGASMLRHASLLLRLAAACH
jgi:hypothetical protein